MTYTENHSPDDCDRCLKKIGRKNLHKLPFIYLDKNDNVHPDMSIILRENGYKCDDGYRQYYVCKSCLDEQSKMN